MIAVALRGVHPDEKGTGRLDVEKAHSKRALDLLLVGMKLEKKYYCFLIVSKTETKLLLSQVLF
jgi:hypothetical protein